MTRLGRLALAALVVTAPVSSFAATASNAAVDACLQTFLTSDLAKNRKVTVQKDLSAAPGPLVLSRFVKVEVIATGRESGKQLARIVCHADAKGAIVAVNGRPTSSVASVAQAR